MRITLISRAGRYHGERFMGKLLALLATCEFPECWHAWVPRIPSIPRTLLPVATLPPTGQLCGYFMIPMLPNRPCPQGCTGR